MTNTDNAVHLKPYAAMLKGWADGKLGPKPTADMLATVHGLGLRPGKQAMANAMYLRPEGATQGQVIMVTGAPQNNKRGDLIKAGHVKRDMGMAPSPAGHTVYRISLTPKGEAFITKRQAAADAGALPGDAPKAPKGKAKAKAASKPRKPKAPATPVTPEPAPAADTAPATA